MKQQKKIESSRLRMRMATGFLAFAMTLGLVPPPLTYATTAVVTQTEEILGSVTSTTLSTTLTTESTATLSTTPETLPPIEGTPSWGMNEEESTTVEPSHWADPYMEKMLEYGYMSSAQAEFPDEMLSRAEFMAVINRAYGYNEMGNRDFTDVLESDWFYEDVSIATNAGFIQGTSDNTAEPLANITRETTAFILGKNLMLPEQVGENMVFTDTYEISDWSRGMVKSTSHYGLMTGYDDGSFRPTENITRGEIAALVLQAVGTPILTGGEVELSEVWGNVTITEAGTILKNTIIAGDLHISNGIGLGGVTLENVTVLGRIVVTGGESEQGEASIILRNVVASELVIDNMNNNMVSVRVDGNSYISTTYARTNCYIEDNTTTDDGLRTIIVDAEPGITVDLSGRVKEVFNISPNTTIRVVSGTVDVLNIDEAATEASTEILQNATILEMNIDVATNVSGDGDLKDVTINASDVVITMLPDNITIRPGVDANINGENMNSNTAEEFSSTPRILAGYPVAADIAPSSLQGIFATNKPGTVYWAVSSVTQGSVSEDDLISPPSYGGSILQNGSVDVLEAEEEITVFIGELEAGGTYYLTAVLVDSRGDRSPVKVTSFSTPDNTVPEFAEGYPYMSSVTHNTAQVTVMATKSCKLYYAVLPAGSVAPTGEEFLAGAVTGSEGSGVQDLTKNKDATFTVSNSLLEVKDYVLYLWLTDADNMNSSEVVFLEFTTLDGTAPIWNQEPTTTTIGVTDVGFNFSLNEDGTVYWIAVVTGTTYPKVAAGDTSGNLTEPWYTDYAKMQVAMGTGGGTGSVSGNMPAVKNETQEFQLTGLDPETAYDLYYVAKDLAGNYSDSIGMVTFNTIDTTPPEFLEQTFSHVATTGGSTEDAVIQPYATSSITLTFSEGIQSTVFEGSTGESFLTLYSAVQSATTSEAETTARNRLAAALANCITLYTWNGNTPTAVVERNGDNENDADVRAGDWIIDYRYATVLYSNGIMSITFPTVESNDRLYSALNLSSGVTYGFKLANIQDSSYDANVMVPAELTLDKFTTIFAEIMLGPASVIGSLPVKRAAWDNVDGLEPGSEISGTYATLDADLRITPSNMTNVDEDIVYEIRFNPNTLVSYNIYYRIVDDKGDYDAVTLRQYYPTMPNTGFWDLTYSNERYANLEKAWTPDENGWIMLSMDNVASSLNTTPTTTPLSIQGNGEGMGTGFVYSFLGYQGSVTPYPTLSSLSEDYQIEMLFEVTSFEGSTTRGEWNGYLEIDTQIYAGNYSYVQDLGPQGSPANSVYQNVSLVSVPTDYAVTKNFTDSIPPDFGPGAPQAFPEDITATLKVSFDGTRTGTLYYAIVEGTNPQNMGPKDESGNNVLTTDIPDINSIYYSEYEPWPLIPVPTLSTPIYLGVTTYIDPDNDSMYGSMSLDKTSRNINLTGLQPLTTYYAYFVTISDNGGGFSTPQLYKFTTAATEKPKYQNVVVDSSTANVTWTTHVATDLNYLMLTDSDASRYIPMITESFYEYLLDGDPEYSLVPNGNNTGDMTLDNYTFMEVYQMSPYWLNNDRYIVGYWQTNENGVDEWVPPVAGYEGELYSILQLLKLEYFETGGNYDHPDYTSSGYSGFDVFASDTMKAELYEAIVNQSQAIVSKGSNSTAIDGSTTAVRNADTGYDPDFEYVLFITGKNVNAEVNAPVAYTHSFYVKGDFAVTDLVGPKIEYVQASYNFNSSTTDDLVGLPTTISGDLTINFDKFLYAVSSSKTFFLQFHEDAPSADAWAGDVIKAVDFWSVSGNGDGTLEMQDSVWSDVPSKVITVKYDDIAVGTTISFFNGQVFFSNKNGVSHNPTTLTFTLKSEDVTTTVVNAATGVTTTTTTRYYWWESNWDGDWNSGSGTSHVTAENKYVNVDTGGFSLYLDSDQTGDLATNRFEMTKNAAASTVQVNVAPDIGSSTFTNASVTSSTGTNIATATVSKEGLVTITPLSVGEGYVTVTHSSNQTILIYIEVLVDPTEATSITITSGVTSENKVNIVKGTSSTVYFKIEPATASADVQLAVTNSGVAVGEIVTNDDGTGYVVLNAESSLTEGASTTASLQSVKNSDVKAAFSIDVIMASTTPTLITGFTFAPTSLSLDMVSSTSSTGTVALTVAPTGYTETYTVVSSDESVATVSNSSGSLTVTGVAVGTATITATSAAGVTNDFTVTVVDTSITGISMTGDDVDTDTSGVDFVKIDLKGVSSATPTATIAPTSISTPTESFTVTSSDETYVTVSGTSSLTITGKKVTDGDPITITVTGATSGKVYTFEVVVSDSVSPGSLMLATTGVATANRTDSSVDYNLTSDNNELQSLTFSIPSGSLYGDNFTVSVEDTSIVSTSFIKNAAGSSKSVTFKGMNTGVTNVTVKDNVNGSEIVLQVTVGNVATSLVATPSSVNSLAVGEETTIFVKAMGNDPEVNFSVKGNSYVSAEITSESGPLIGITLKGLRTSSMSQTITVTDSVSGKTLDILVGSVGY